MTLQETLKAMTTQQKPEQLSETARGILDDLNLRLSWAIDTWSQLTNTRRDREHLSWPQLPGPATPQLLVRNSPSLKSRNNSSPSLSNSAETTQAYDTPKHWSGCLEAQTMHNPSSLRPALPTPWWMQDKDHYALCRPREQGQLENAARAVRSNRSHTSAPAPGERRQV